MDFRNVAGRLKNIRPTLFVAISFLVVILLGAGLLCLPLATKSGRSAGFVDSLFVATSATCVTGLSPMDTWSFWSPFGQGVILALIQIGGLGFMTMVTVFSFLLRRRIGLQERLIMVQSMNITDIHGVVRLVRLALFGTLIFEGIGSVILAICFIPDFGIVDGIIKGIFHSVSAFCNAGFDLMGEVDPGGSLAPYATHPVVNLVIMALIIIGGLGFFVWEDIYINRKFSKLRVHSKLVLVMTAGLIAFGTICIFLLEYSNDGTIGEMNIFEKFIASMFQSVTTRTAGFATVDQGALTSGSKFITVMLMFVGGSPGSTAGGLKTTTFALLIIGSFQLIRGNKDVNIWKRRVSLRQILSSGTLFAMMVFLVIIGVFVMMISENLDMSDMMFEVVSAIGTVGLSTGITGILGVPSKIILTVLMYLGRVGIMTIGIAAMMGPGSEKNIRYPKTSIMIG